MEKYENHLYFIISEETLKSFKQTHFLNYINYCNTLKGSIKDGKLGKKEALELTKIQIIIDKIFSLGVNSSYEYIFNFFLKDIFLKYEKSVRIFNEFYYDTL